MFVVVAILVIATCVYMGLVPTLRDIMDKRFTAMPGERAAGEGHDVQSTTPAPLRPAQSESPTTPTVVGAGNLPVHAGVSRKHPAPM